MRKILTIAAVCAVALAGNAGVNDNETLSKFVKESQEEIAKAGAANAEMIVEQSPFGDVIVMIEKVPVTGDQLKQVPVDMIKPELIKGLKQENAFPAEVVEAMGKERVNFIYRMQGTDGNSLDIFMTAADLK